MKLNSDRNRNKHILIKLSVFIAKNVNIDSVFFVSAMKGELISCTHKDIYFLETNTNSEVREVFLL